MKQTKNIQEFIFGVAYYHINSRSGDTVILRVDYQNNTYSLKNKSEPFSQKFQQEVSEIAKDLLERKHGVNFAERVR